MRALQGLLLLIFLAAIGIFAAYNTESTTVRFLQWSVTSSKALVMIAVYLLGMLSGWTVVAFLTRGIRRVTEHPAERV